MRTCTRRIEFDAAHRVLRHESKCAHLHGHRYVVDVTCESPELDTIGRVVDFSVIKAVFGKWLDDTCDHGTLVYSDDHKLISWLRDNEQKMMILYSNPTAENLAVHFKTVAGEMLESYGVTVSRVVVYETPNCSAEA